MSSKARILVVDNHERTVRAIQRILEKQGYKVLTALWRNLVKKGM